MLSSSAALFFLTLGRVEAIAWSRRREEVGPDRRLLLVSLPFVFIEFSLLHLLLHIPEAGAPPGSEEETFLRPLLGSGCSGEKWREER